MRLLVGLLALLFAAAAAAILYAVGMPGRSFKGPIPPPTKAEQALAATLRGYVVAIASRPHNTYHPAALEATARTIEAALESFGYVPKSQKFMAGGVEVRNIEAVIEPAAIGGSPSTGVTTIVVGAHYDSAGIAPGANDNGSGVAALLVLAQELKDHPMRMTRLRLVFFVNEEPPHFQTETMGSLVYARTLAASGEKVRAMLCLETIGAYYDTPGSQRYPLGLDRMLGFALPTTGNFVTIVGTTNARPLTAEVTRLFRDGTAFPSLGAVAPGLIPGIDWSDHWSFGQIGVPAVMITDTAPFRYPHYHRPSDTPDKLNYDRFARVTAGLVRVIRAMAY